MAGALFACTADTPSPSVEQPSPTPTFECPNQASTVEDANALVGEPATSDVDGDGSSDAVSIHLDTAGERGCQAFLVVEVDTGRLSLPIWEVGPQGGLPQPTIKAIVDIDSDGSSEIVLDEALGASTQFVGLYALSDGGLTWVRSRTDQGGLFPYGGSVGHLEAVDCTNEGSLVVSAALPSPDRSAQARQIYDVRRRFFSLEDGQLVAENTETESLPIDDLERFPEYLSSPFGNCPPPPS
ncbi:MAG: hypothetical protein QOK47_1177 [Actinomycetota bacterium]|nr:hypothetical protein [Actinomycetota bacterium]